MSFKLSAGQALGSQEVATPEKKPRAALDVSERTRAKRIELLESAMLAMDRANRKVNAARRKCDEYEEIGLHEISSSLARVRESLSSFLWIKRSQGSAS